MADKFPDKTSPRSAVDAFLRQAEKLPARTDDQPRRGGRLIFALDATASRQPTWDRACQLHDSMFTAAEATGGLDIQLCFYRGFKEFFASPWYRQPAPLKAQMTRVQCAGGFTQIARLLRHALEEQRQQPVDALVFVGDAIEESVDTLCQMAGECGLRQLPLFLFQEGGNRHVTDALQQMARLSNGAWAHFDAGSAEQLAELLRAVATYASGGREALEKLTSGTARKLLTQL